MRYLRFVVVVLGILWAASCSSTSNQTTTPQPTRNTEKFSVSTEDGGGTFTPALNIQESGDTTTVTVKAQDASQLTEAYLHLNYDATQYTPTNVTFGDFLGQTDEVLTLAVTQVSGDVQLGAAQIANSGVQPQNGVGVLATVTFEKTPFTGSRNVSSFPKGQANKVSDLEIVNQVGNNVTLHWTERNKGDYNNDGVVGITDLSPMALYFGQQVASTSNPTHAAMIDGDGNGEVNIADLSPIGGNFNNQVTGYSLYSNADGTNELMFVPRPTGNDPKRPVEYTQEVTTSGSEQFVVRGVGSNPSEKGDSSNVAQLIIVPGPPEAPTNVQASVNDEVVGNLQIKVTWTASVSTDVKGYIVQRKLASDPESSYADLLVDPLSSTQYVDHSGLSDADYNYRVRAIDKEIPALESGYSNEATGHPFIQIQEPPTNVSAQTDPVYASSVQVTWDADDSMFFFNVYRKGPGETEFTLANPTPISKLQQGTQFSDKDGGLTEHETYEYYVTSLDEYKLIESGESNHASAAASDALQLQVISVETDKTTHHVGGTEPVSNIVATANTDQATWTWTSTLNDVTGSGNEVTWKPSGNPQPQVVTITATAHFGAQQASMDCKFYLTDRKIETSYGNNGHFYDWNPSAPSVLQPTTPYRPLSYYVANPDNSKVVFYDAWGIWCHWCRSEFPNIWHMTEHYSDFQYVGVDDSGETISAVTAYFNAPYWDSWNPSHPEITNLAGWDSYCGVDPHEPDYGMGSSYPTALVFDRDGNIRWHSEKEPSPYYGSADGCNVLNDCVQQLTGETLCPYTNWDFYH